MTDLNSARKELAPSGRLRVALAISPAPSPSFATRDPVTGEPAGAAADLGRRLALRLKVPMEFVIYSSSGEITDAASSDSWDVAFMPVDAERAKKVDFGAAYALLESTYLVPAGSEIRTMADIDRPGVRVVGIGNTTTARSAARTLTRTRLTEVKSVDDMLALLQAGKAEAIALSRDSLRSLLARLPGGRILDGHFQATSAAIAVPKGRPATLAYVTAFIEEAKVSGVVRRALDEAGLANTTLAPIAASRSQP